MLWVVWVVELIYRCGGKKEHFIRSVLVVFPPLLSTVYQCEECLSSRGVGAHGWVVRFC